MQIIFKIPLITLALMSPIFASNYLPITIINNTNIAPASDIYLFIKAQKNNQACVMSFSTNNNGQCHIVSSQDLLSSYDYPLSQFSAGVNQQGQKIYTINIPPVDAGRLYFSVGKKMDFYVDNSDPSHLTIPDPDGFQTRDLNYYTLFDKIEFTYNQAGSWINPTAVDFFSIPILIREPGATGSFTSAGINLSRQAIIDSITNTFQSSKSWQNLILTYHGEMQTTPSNYNLGQTVLRIVAPGKAMELNAGNTPFPTNYLNDTYSSFAYINSLWQYYQQPGNTVVIDASELKGNKNAKPLTNYIFTGHVNPDGQFIFTNADQSDTVILDKPDSISFFAGAEGSFNAENNTPKAIIVRQITSAFEVGLLPAPSGIILNQNYFKQQKLSHHYYQVDPLLSPTGQVTGPWYDLYSKAFHGLGFPIYTFAYDDALLQDGTLYSENTAKSVTITLGDMSNTTIPDPTIDPNTHYDLTFTLGQDTQHQHYRVIINPNSNNPITLNPDKPVIEKKVTTPITISIDNINYEMSIQHPMVVPQVINDTTVKIAQAIVIAPNHDPADPNSYTINLPAMMKP